MKRLWKWVRALFRRGRETSTVEPISEAEMKFKTLLDYEIRKAKGRLAYRPWMPSMRQPNKGVEMGGMWRGLDNFKTDRHPMKVDLTRYMTDDD